MQALTPGPRGGSQARPLSHWAAGMLVGTVLVTALVLGLVMERFVRHHEVKQSRQALAQVAWQLRDELERGMAERYDEVRSMAASRQLHALDHPEQLREALQAVKDKSPLSTWVGVADAQGQVLAAADGLLEGRSAAQRPWFKRAVQGVPYVGDVHPAALLAGVLPASAEPWRFVDMSAPIVEGGRVQGVLAVHLSWEWARALSRGLLSPELAARGVEVRIARADGEVLVGPPGDADARLDLPALQRAAVADPGWFAAGSGGLVAVEPTRARDRYPGLGWVVVVRQPMDAALAAYGTLRLQLVLATLAIALALGLLTPALARRLAGPLRQITGALAQAAPGALRLRGAAYREAHELADTLQALRGRDAQQAAELRGLNASLEERVAERTAELERARRDLRNIINALPSAICHWDAGLLNRFANEAYRDWFGVDPLTVTGWHFSAVFGKEAFERNRLHLEAALRGERGTVERTFLRPNGRGERHALMHFIPDQSGGGPASGLYIVLHDVTEIVQSRRALDAERQRLQDILRDTNVGTWEWHVPTGELRIDERWASLLGHTAAELRPATVQTWEALTHPQDVAEAYRLLQAHFAGETEVYDVELRMRHREGHWVWLHSTARVASRGADGAPQWVHGIHQDVTRAKATQQQLAANQAFLERIGRVSGVGGWQLDLRSGAVEWSAQLCRVVGAGPESMATLEQVLDFYPGPGREQLREAVRAAAEEGRGYDLELPFRTADGRDVWVRTVGEPDRDPSDPDGPPVRVTGTFQDVSERHAVASALREAKRAAESANAAKSEFLANMSHEIRTPLNAVIGLSYLLEQSRLDGEQRDAVAKIQVASRTLLGVVNDVLDLAKIEARQMELELRSFDLRALLQDLRDLFSPQAHAKGLRLAVDDPADAPDLLVGDDTRLRQVLVNLLSNALKFTESGEVALQVRAEPLDDARVRLHLAVQDSGAGMAPALLQRLFTPFTQADAGTTRRFGGTGLGLSIVRRLVNLMGGDVSVRSEVGRGSRFDVTLELGLSRRPGEAGSALQVLVAGGDAARRTALGDLCRRLGWRAQASALKEASAQLQPTGAQAGTAGEAQAAAPDVLLLDATAGEAGGLLAQALAAHRVTGRPVVLLTAAAGADEAPDGGDVALLPHGRLAWPASTSSLFSAVAQALARHGAAPDHAVPGQQPLPVGCRALPGVRVLVVDDSGINREVAQRILALQGALVSTCNDGAQALERLRRDAAVYDLVLMDVQMPVMDGLEATRRIRGELGLTRLPVLALSAGALVSERANARAAGMDDFLSKPLDPRTLVSSIRWHVEKAQGQPLPYESSVTAAVAAAPAEPPAPDWPVVAGVDTAAVSRRLGGDFKLFKELLARLLQTLAELEDEAAALRLLAEDAPGLAARMHRLRGSASMLGLTRLQETAHALELGLKGGGLSAADAQNLCVCLSRQIVEYRVAARAVLEPPVVELPMAVDAPLDGAAIDEFVSLLESQSFEAEEMFGKMASQLRAILDEEEFKILSEAVEGLDFAKAGKILTTSIRFKK
ncbi:ATP-binding protein [Azohydromonas lata]|uniref:histidine kinase n=1 Tax=Azohydromonas lata TaxID=45677 RepID=A0ABU5IFT7_9BURK|nr:ATP-binding protein [Azohydromonas lata]MDZ5457385.1 ATP-binding protein [Azohydromonas lata]